MTYRAWFQVHRWISVGLGLLLVFWVASGMVMQFPLPSAFYTQPGTSASLSLTDYGLSPAEAGRRAGLLSGARPHGVAFQRLRDAMVYVVTFPARPPLLLDAQHGEPIPITAALAEAIARDGVGMTPPLLGIDTVTRQTTAYPYGERPAFRLRFGDASRTVVFVGQATGAVHHTTRRSRFQTWMAQWHLAGPLAYGERSETARNAAVWITSLIILAGLVAGILLVLPKRWWRHQPGATS